MGRCRSCSSLPPSDTLSTPRPPVWPSPDSRSSRDSRSVRNAIPDGAGTPLTGNSRPGNVDIEGQPAPLKASDRIAVPLRSVTPGYFQLLGMPVAAGRAFRSTDNRTTPSVAVINQALAERYFPQAQRFHRARRLPRIRPKLTEGCPPRFDVAFHPGGGRRRSTVEDGTGRYLKTPHGDAKCTIIGILVPNLIGDYRQKRATHGWFEVVYHVGQISDSR